jgi:hypothetical protein
MSDFLQESLSPLSPLIRFGTSTWAYDGWQGQVYKQAYARTVFSRECLGEFCQYLYKGQPLFRTVGFHILSPSDGQPAYPVPPSNPGRLRDVQQSLGGN